MSYILEHLALVNQESLYQKTRENIIRYLNLLNYPPQVLRAQHIIKKKKKNIKKTKTTTPVTEVDNDSTKLKYELSYDQLLTTNQTESNDNQSVIQQQPYQQHTYYNPKLPPPPLHDNPYYPYYPYYPPPAPHSFDKNPHYNPLHSQISSNTSNPTNEGTKKNKKPALLQQTSFEESEDKKVQFDIPSDNLQTDTNEKPTRSKRNSKNSKISTPIRKSPRRKGGILDIAVNKVITINDDDETPQKSDHSFMDTESDYHTQTEEMHDDDNDDDSN